MTYFILGLCLLAALVASWHLSAEPLWTRADAAADEIKPHTLSAQDIIAAENAACADDAPSLPARLPADARPDRHI